MRFLVVTILLRDLFLTASQALVTMRSANAIFQNVNVPNSVTNLGADAFF